MQIEDGDFLLYLDAGCKVIRDPHILFDLAANTTHGIMLFDMPHLMYSWTKRDTFVLLGGDNSTYWNHTTVLGGFIVIRKSNFAVSLVREWLHAAEDERILTGRTFSLY